MRAQERICRKPSGLVGLVALVLALATAPLAMAQPVDRLAELVAGPQRSPANTARDPYRKPYEVLKFFGLRPDSTVVEVLPGSAGYWTEIVAPYVRDKGLYITAGRDENAPPGYLQDHARMLKKYADDPATFGKVQVTKFLADRYEIAPPGSADLVLTFRNLHNWLDRNEIDGALKAFHTALKPGGILGVADHRGRADMTQEAQMRTGYVRQDFAIGLIEKAGFKLIGTSEVKANPKDTKDYPEGVWSLPPTYREGDKNREKYAAIGESDRFVLMFIKR
ncbi:MULTISPECIES: class I SAM-dependent methyltransferase [unclassified Beijerinckia]|uniref:class I SAM-dependent methyltransferase n=1 Tax=unclassified Beijerinckia TaxID=2638183 RepID=UPI000899B64A|nr:MULTISPECIES: class I SAM-dependent methyltransferase [unclassified Beijerinckia]MDH7796735.1 putative methyltransferase [Beijerinckia sp. GAS462]SEC57727.1 Predicted methyltransferase [Beijerinckia sp. 28-YEA-48]